MTNTQPRNTEASPSFNELPFNYIQQGNAEQLECDQCEGIYYQRYYATPDQWFITERTPCSCMIPILQQSERERQLKERQVWRNNILNGIDKYFRNYNLMTDQTHGHMTLNSYEPSHPSQAEALKELKLYRGDKSICLYGKQGRGKTHLAIGAAREVYKQGKTVLAVKVIDLLDTIKRTYDRKDEKSEAQVLYVLRNVDLLLIDDIGQEQSTEWAKSKFYEIIDYRHKRKATIFTTNMSGAETEKKEGAGLVSRIMGTELIFRIEGDKDYRLTGR